MPRNERQKTATQGEDELNALFTFHGRRCPARTEKVRETTVEVMTAGLACGVGLAVGYTYVSCMCIATKTIDVAKPMLRAS